MPKILDSNYFQINGWMVNKLKLSGNELMVYAIIYGFSQDGESKFTGSINYLCDFINSTRPTIIKCLKSLVDKNYIFKDTNIINGVTFNTYKVNLQVVKKLYQGSKETLQGGSKETLPNNKLPYKENNNKLYIDIVEIEEIVNYLNEKTGKHFRSDIDNTQKLIKKRAKEGFKVDDFKKVIDIKTKKWGKDKKMKIYLRPETLFGSKFEAYLNEEPNKEIYEVKINHEDLAKYNDVEIDF